MRKYLFLGAICFFGMAQPVQAALRAGDKNEIDKSIEAQMPSDWRACQKATDCELIQYGCKGIMAANKQHLSEATDLAFKIGGHPAEIKCAPQLTPAGVIYVPACNRSLCFAMFSAE